MMLIYTLLRYSYLYLFGGGNDRGQIALLHLLDPDGARRLLRCRSRFTHGISPKG